MNAPSSIRLPLSDLRPSLPARAYAAARLVPQGLGWLLARLALGLIRAYQLVLSPMRPPTCRFYPSCSAYAVTAIERHGAVRGGYLAGRRLLRCHPWNPGGVDHVPPPRNALAPAPISRRAA